MAETLSAKLQAAAVEAATLLLDEAVGRMRSGSRPLQERMAAASLILDMHQALVPAPPWARPEPVVAALAGRYESGWSDPVVSVNIHPPFEEGQVRVVAQPPPVAEAVMTRVTRGKRGK